ncbi:rhomboid family intramembrane serine protease [Maricaulis sp.]|uniref:rhomboid family intramembrane serine protease n=1 Tax=Maricaulis sp. TaxID=1486257 RepID=UPI00260C5ED8|nr:rhomboid family intramembrane serine protease [Maricaulis sp.]
MSVPERDDERHEPPGGGSRQPIFNNIPLGVLIVAVPIIVVALLPFIAPELERLIFAASVVVVPGPGQIAPQQPLGPWAPYLLHVLIHFGVLHIAMNLTILVSAGRAVAAGFGTDSRGTLGFLVFFALCSIAGAATQVALSGNEAATMGGASTGVSGVLAAAGWVMGGYRGMLRLAVPWIGLNLVFGIIGIGFPIPIGWVAHIGGTLAGAVLFPLLQPVFSSR